MSVNTPRNRIFSCFFFSLFIRQRVSRRRHFFLCVFLVTQRNFFGPFASTILKEEKTNKTQKILIRPLLLLVTYLILLVGVMRDCSQAEMPRVWRPALAVSKGEED